MKNKKRLNYYLNLPERDIRSCYYRIDRTTTRSIFFISDVVPITDKYIDGPHAGPDQNPYVIKNQPLISELERKIFRILSYENAHNNIFRQHITDVKNALIDELEQNSAPELEELPSAAPFLFAFRAVFLSPPPFSSS